VGDAELQVAIIDQDVAGNKYAKAVSGTLCEYRDTTPPVITDSDDLRLVITRETDPLPLYAQELCSRPGQKVSLPAACIQDARGHLRVMIGVIAYKDGVQYYLAEEEATFTMRNILTPTPVDTLVGSRYDAWLNLCPVTSEYSALPDGTGTQFEFYVRLVQPLVSVTYTVGHYSTIVNTPPYALNDAGPGFVIVRSTLSPSAAGAQDVGCAGAARVGDVSVGVWVWTVWRRGLVWRWTCRMCFPGGVGG
jgi:hypothetical protein